MRVAEPWWCLIVGKWEEKTSFSPWGFLIYISAVLKWVVCRRGQILEAVVYGSGLFVFCSLGIAWKLLLKLCKNIPGRVCTQFSFFGRAKDWEKVVQGGLQRSFSVECAQVLHSDCVGSRSGRAEHCHWLLPAPRGAMALQPPGIWVPWSKVLSRAGLLPHP